MKPAAFEYHRPANVAEALDVLNEAGDDGKVLAGGQSLVPLLNMRLAYPGQLIDINRLAELDTVEVTSDAVTVGALARQARVERSADVSRVNPILVEALRNVAHPVIRNRGTVVGSIAHADPAAEMPAILLLLGGSVRVANAAGSRVVEAADFFLGPLTADVAATELVTQVVFPNPPPGSGVAFVELARRHGDFAMAGVGVTVVTGGDGTIASARAGFVGVGFVPVMVDLSAALNGQEPGNLDTEGAVELARDELDPDEDIHATAEYRRHLAGALLDRALHVAAAGVGPGGTT